MVTGPKSPAIQQVSDLSDKELYVRRSSSYYESLERLNEQLRVEGKAPIRIREADETSKTRISSRW